MKKFILGFILVVFSFSLIFADRIDDEGKKFFKGNLSVKALAYTVNKSTNIELRAYAARMLKKYPKNEKAAEALINGIRFGFVTRYRYKDDYVSESYLVRIEAARSIGYFNIYHDKFAFNLIPIVKSDPKKEVQGVASISLGKIGGKKGGKLQSRVTDILLEKIRHVPKRNSQLVRSIVIGLGYNKDKKAYSYLHKILSSGYPRVVNISVIWALKQLK